MSTFLAIDFETANYSADSACAIGLVRAENGKITDERSYLIRPPSQDFFFTHIHGITWPDVIMEPTFGELWSEITPWFEGVDFFSAHNAGFDRKVLKSCCDTYELENPETEFICTVKLARDMWSVRPTKLPNVAEYLGLSLNHHDALSDSRACANIVLAAERDGWGHDTGMEFVGERYTALED
ncbi:exonuclease [Sneathiella sp. P13V-1]|uniref:3'-5' exonuclease n=1 Tax=Sneathiella sp. P13V-1 TaxID=2697366 RepID=UPI00187BB89C|nr:3'-5' exonuclease [Sneathiella sp. P13V-1]MBE7635368.1 exonuclease [Sneathiella sp. P13V-1]